ncbi:hypothetical protein KJ612_03960 [Myxococcota bacterium]|nr:hypothetical protein [Myxococcota bacterium]
MRTFLRFAFALALGLAPAACDDDPNNTNNTNNINNVNNVNNINNVNNTNNLPGPLGGELVLEEYEMIGSHYSRMTGVIGAGGFPVWQEETLVEGDCRLLKYVAHYCEEYCEGVCVAENVCEPWPTFVDGGTLTITGAKTAIAADPGDFGFFGANGYSWYGDAADLFDDGDVLTAIFSGGAAAAFSVDASGVAPLVLTTVQNDEITLENGGDTVFEWVPGTGSGTRVRVTLNANSSGGHGSPYLAIIECDTADDGSLTIPQALIEGFPETYRWEMCAGVDCPLSSAMRYRRGIMPVAGGDFDFRVGSSVSFWIVHEALQR